MLSRVTSQLVHVPGQAKILIEFGYNRTDSPNHFQPDGWRSLYLDNQGKPAHFFGGKFITPHGWFTHLIVEQRRLCAIWVKFSDGSIKCVYHYNIPSGLDEESTWCT